MRSILGYLLLLVMGCLVPHHRHQQQQLRSQYLSTTSRAESIPAAPAPAVVLILTAAMGLRLA
ncbi:hypothetical protein M405DRAFT_812325 [Rhizopogon salebrosus TDB-379]|nr:hypothetical protein M405DRAFT_812325 [Rhizopogon salebrosus TDB-379]